MCDSIDFFIFCQVTGEGRSAEEENVPPRGPCPQNVPQQNTKHTLTCIKSIRALINWKDMIRQTHFVNSYKLVWSSARCTGAVARCMPRYFSTEPVREGPRSHSHFRSFEKARPTTFSPEDHYDYSIADHTGRQQNHIWSEEELNEKLSTLYRHKPATVSDHIMNKLVTHLFSISLHIIRCMGCTTVLTS